LFPSPDSSLPQEPAFPDVYDARIFGVGQGTESFRALNPQSVSLPSLPSQSRLDCGLFRQEPAITELDWHFTPIPRLQEHLLVEPLQASTQFYPRFTLPRIRSLGFGSKPCDSKALSYLAPRKLRAIAFASGAPMIGLPLPHSITPWHVIRNAR